jgi:hypothetical protein
MTDLVERRPGRPKGSRNKNRVATAERINQEGDPIGFLCKVIRGGKIKAAAVDGATSRSWCYPTIDQRKDAATTLAKKVMPDLRPSDFGININGDGGVVLQVVTGVARGPNDPPLSEAEAERWRRIVDVTPTPPPPDNTGSLSTPESVTGSDSPAALPAGCPWHPSSSPADAPWPALPSSDPLADDNLGASDARIAALNSRAAKFVA